MISPTSHEIFSTIFFLKKNADQEIPSYFLKAGASILSPFLSYFFSFAFTLGIFPDDLKTAKVLPLFKSPYESGVYNYRLISVLLLSLPSSSKKLALDFLQQYFCACKYASNILAQY